jgi:uncharacterized protein YaaQ
MSNSEAMKLILVILNDAESDTILKALLDEGYRVTRIASTGGFLRRGSSTLMIGVEAEKVEKAIQLIHEHTPPSMDPGVKRVVVFVLKVDRFEQL